MPEITANAFATRTSKSTSTSAFVSTSSLSSSLFCRRPLPLSSTCSSSVPVHPHHQQRSPTPVTCTARSSRKPKRRPPSRSRSRRPPTPPSRPTAVDDPLLNDNDIDTTDITTFVSCPVCFNSLMIRPEQLMAGPRQLNCNCCGKTTEARLEQLEDVDGTFDYKQWRIEHNSYQMTEAEISELQRFAVDVNNSSP